MGGEKGETPCYPPYVGHQVGARPSWSPTAGRYKTCPYRDTAFGFVILNEMKNLVVFFVIPMEAGI